MDYRFTERQNKVLSLMDRVLDGKKANLELHAFEDFGCGTMYLELEWQVKEAQRARDSFYETCERLAQVEAAR